jgi:uncharacterized protein YcfL
MKNFLLITLLFSLCSCAPYNKNPVTTLAPNEDGGVNVVSGNRSKVKNVNITRSFNQEVNGKLLAKVEVENTSSSPTVFMYKEDGSIDSSSSTWQTATISGKEVKTLQDVNVRGGATDFRILLKKSK